MDWFGRRVSIVWCTILTSNECVGNDIDIPMALVMLSAFLGPIAGPIAGGYLVELGPGGVNESWRWTIWILLILALAIGIILTWVPETLQQTQKTVESYMTSIASPIVLLADPVLLLLSTYLSLIYGILCDFIPSNMELGTYILTIT